MPTLENDRLVFRFPQIETDASFAIDFQRTLRIPDTDRTYSLPPGLGKFPLRHTEDYSENLPGQMVERGGVILPMWQAEALWLNFRNNGPDWDLDFPVAIKVAAGKINAVTGDGWQPALHREPQDYLVSPHQPWLDGFAVEKGVIRQFVAMPLGEGYSVEEQLTGEAEWGGLQIMVVPLKAGVWRAKRKAWEKRQKQKTELEDFRVTNFDNVLFSMNPPMSLAAGGRMRQEIYPDPYGIDDWDMASAERVFVSLLHAKDWKKVTGEAAPNQPPTARDYAESGLPWFDYYGKDQAPLPGGQKLAPVKSLAKLFKQFTGASLPNSEDVETGEPTPLGPDSKGPRPVKTSNSWERQ